MRPAVEALAAALGRAREAGGRPAGPVRVHCFVNAARLFIRPMLRRFHRAFPDVRLDLTLDDTVADVIAGGYDVAIRLGEVIERDLIAVRLGPDLSQIAVASPDYLATHGTPKTPGELVRYPCIGWRWPGRDVPYRWEFHEDGRWFEVAVEGPLLTNSRELCVQAALDGLGVALATREHVAPYVADGRLVPLLERWSEPFPGYHLCYPAQRQMAPALRAFIDAVRETAREHGGV